MFAKRIEELRIYIIALQLANEIHCLVEKIPNWWRIKDAKQIKRSSSSVPSNIVEGFCQRFYPRKFLHYLNIALGSSDETKNHLRLLYKKNYINKDQRDHYVNRYKNLSIKILNLINYLKQKHNIIL